MATLRMAITRHRHTNRVSGDTYRITLILIITNQREVREQKELKANRHSKQTLHVLTHLASETREPCKTPYETSLSMVALKDRPPALV